MFLFVFQALMIFIKKKYCRVDLTYNTTFRAHVHYMPMCVHFSRTCVPTCLHAYFYFFLPTCLCALNYFVPMCVHLPRAYVSATAHKKYWGSLLYFVLPFFSRLFDLSFHSKPQNKILLLKLHAPILSCGILLSPLEHAQRQ